ncbi:reverse transcriptase domain-containing protein [Tanacetum coccineum]
MTKTTEVAKEETTREMIIKSLTRLRDISAGRLGIITVSPITNELRDQANKRAMFPTPKGIATLVTRSTIIAECRLREEKQILTEKPPEVHETGQPDEGANLTEQILVNKHEYRWDTKEEEKRRGFSADEGVDNIPSIIDTTLSEGDTICIPSSGKGGCLSSTADRSKRKIMPSPAQFWQIDFLSDAPEGEAEEEYFRMPEVPPEVDDTKVWTLFTDGAASLKGSGAGLVLIGPSGLEYTYALRLTFVSTNNEAEYEALLAGLRIARKMKVSGIELKKAGEGGWGIFKQVSLYPFNHLTKEILVEVLNERSTDAEEVQTIVEEEGENWMTPIIKYLEEEIVPLSTKMKALGPCVPRLTIINDRVRSLFKRILGPDVEVCGSFTSKLCNRESHGILWKAHRPKSSGQERKQLRKAITGPQIAC